MISQQQSAFVPGQLIQDNSILAYEIFHALSHKKGTKGSFALKIDMSKAYDQMEWNLILLTLKMFGFSPRWVSWIKACLSSVSHCILLEGNPHGLITTSRGLHQGDPLSPFIFGIGMEILSQILDKAQDLSLVKGFHLSQGGLCG